MSWLKKWDRCVFKKAPATNARAKALAEKRKKAREAQTNPGSFSQQAEVTFSHNKVTSSLTYLHLGRRSLWTTCRENHASVWSSWTRENNSRACARKASRLPSSRDQRKVGFGIEHHGTHTHAHEHYKCSDDRSAKVVTERIKNATESRAISAGGKISENKPTCIVIDEIDGAVGGGDTGFMRTLIRFIQDGSKVPTGKGTLSSQLLPVLTDS